MTVLSELSGVEVSALFGVLNGQYRGQLIEAMSFSKLRVGSVNQIRFAHFVRSASC